MTVSPDEKVGLPIHVLLYRAAESGRRALKIGKLRQDRPSDAADELLANEKKLYAAYAAALRVRAADVVQYCADMRIWCTEEFLCKSPIPMAMIICQHVSGLGVDEWLDE